MHRSSSRRIGRSVPRQWSFLHLHHPFRGSGPVSINSCLISCIANQLANPRGSGFAVGWDYAISWLTVLPFELTAAGITIRFWRDDINIGVWITVFLFVLCVIQIFGVRGYGEGLCNPLHLTTQLLNISSRIHPQHD
jgi:hypothetical protein